MRVVGGIAWSRVFIVIEEVGGPRISRFPICKSISLISAQSFNISCVIILWVRTTVLLITISEVHKLWESRRALTSFLPTNCQDPGLVWGSSAKFGTGYRVSETSLGEILLDSVSMWAFQVSLCSFYLMALWTRVTMCLEILLFVRLWLKEMDRYNDQLSQNGKYFSDKNENDDRYLIYARLSPAASTATTRPGLWWLRHSNALLKLSDLAPSNHQSRHT